MSIYFLDHRTADQDDTRIHHCLQWNILVSIYGPLGYGLSTLPLRHSAKGSREGGGGRNLDLQFTSLEKSEIFPILKDCQIFNAIKVFGISILVFINFKYEKNYSCISSKKLICAYDLGPVFFKALLSMSGSSCPEHQKCTHTSKYVREQIC